MMKCPLCGSDDTNWIKTLLDNRTEGFEEYACNNCKGHFELGIELEQIEYTGKDNIFPFEQE